MDQMTQCYTTKRMTRRWPMVIFFNMLDVSALNAIIIWLKLQNSFQPKKMVRRTLLIKLAKSLAGISSEKSLSTSETVSYSTSLDAKKEKYVTCVLLNKTGNPRCTVMIVK